MTVSPVSDENQKALVTGASGGLGAAVAKKLAARGVEVWLAARRRPELETVAREIHEAGGRAHVLTLDLAQCDATAAAVERLDAEVGGIDLLIANAAIAGATAARPISRSTWQDVNRIIQTNLAGNLATVMPLVPKMLERGRGHIVGISSLAALSPNPRTVPYGASKAGLSYFLTAMGMELRPLGVFVTVVEPGFMRTPAAEGITEPMPFMVEVDRAAMLIDRAVQKKTRTLRFPLAMSTLQRLPGLLPAPMEERLVRWATRER
jgi:short-subunit dehydrogenase